MALGLQIKNLDKVIAELKAYPQDIDRIINNEFKVFGQGVVSDAQRLAPVNEGRLRQSISSQTSDLQVNISVNVDYAAYLEFGTKAFAASYVGTLPADWQTLANQFKGATGGSFKEMVLRITEWVRHKGLGSGFVGSVGITGLYSVKTRKRVGSKKTQAQQDKQAAYAIAIKILKTGIKAQPYLFPAFEINVPKLITNLKANLPAK